MHSKELYGNKNARVKFIGEEKKIHIYILKGEDMGAHIYWRIEMVN